MQSLPGPTLPKVQPQRKRPAPAAKPQLSPQEKAARARDLADGLREFAPETNDLMSPWMLLLADELARWAAEMDEYANFMMAGFDPGSQGRAETRNPFNTCTCTKLRRRCKCRCPLPNPLETWLAALVGCGL